MRLRTVSVVWLVLFASFDVAASADPALLDTRKPEPTAKISWPAVSSVLDGTDLVEMKTLSVLPFELKGVEGTYRTEQGGSVLSLIIRRTDSRLEAERTYREPGRKPLTKAYAFDTTTSEGAVSSRGEAFLKKTREGLLMFEKQSGVDSIPANYWVYYIRKQ